MQYDEKMFAPFLNKKIIANFIVDGQERKAIGILSAIYPDKIFIKGDHREWLVNANALQNINTLD